MSPPRAPQAVPLRPTNVARRQMEGDVEPEDEVRPSPRELPALIPGDVLAVRNDDKVTIEFVWNRRQWIVAPKQTKNVPFEAIVNVLGDPRSDDLPAMYDDGNGNTGQVVRRSDELSRLFARYGIEFEDKGKLVEAAPLLVVKNPETGQRVDFPAHNPTMHPYPVLNVQSRDVSGNRRQFDMLAAENAELKGNYARLEGLVNELLNKQAQGIEPEG